MSTSTTSLFDAITNAATTAAATAVAEMVNPDEFRAFSERTAPSDGFVLPVAPKNITMYGYQLAAVESLLKFSRGIVGFSPGMGKTVVAQAVVAARIAEGKAEGALPQRALVICPPSLRTDPWDREFTKEFPGLKVAIIKGRKEADIPSDVDVVICGDSTVAARKEDIIKWAPTVIVVDEAQRMKSLSAQRAAATQEIVDTAMTSHRANPEAFVRPTVAMLTGTLAVGRPDEMWRPARIAGKDVVRAISGADSYDSFVKRWCVLEAVHTPRGDKYKTVGCVDPEGLHERLRQSAYLRVERDAVLDMPEKVWAVRGLELNGDLATYRRMEKDFISFIADSKGRAAAERSKKAEAVVKLMALWQEAGKAKVKAAADYVADLVQQGEQVVLMGWHSAAIALMREALQAIKPHEGSDERIRVVEVVGGMSDAQKTQAQDLFKAGKADVLLGQIIAAGTGLNLEAAANLVFFQLPWTPGDLVQASDRIYRVTQKRECTIHVLNALDTVDERMFGVLQSKARVVDLINAGQTGISLGVSEDAIIGAVLEDYGWDG